MGVSPQNYSDVSNCNPLSIYAETYLSVEDVCGRATHPGSECLATNALEASTAPANSVREKH